MLCIIFLFTVMRSVPKCAQYLTGSFFRLTANAAVTPKFTPQLCVGETGRDSFASDGELTQLLHFTPKFNLTQPCQFLLVIFTTLPMLFPVPSCYWWVLVCLCLKGSGSTSADLFYCVLPLHKSNAKSNPNLISHVNENTCVHLQGL